MKMAFYYLKHLFEKHIAYCGEGVGWMARSQDQAYIQGERCKY